MFRLLVICAFVALSTCADNDTTMAPLPTAEAITTAETTTDKPTTAASTMGPTTSVAPITTPSPKNAKFTVKNETSGEICLIFEVTGQFNITYLHKENKNETKVFHLPTTGTTTSGHCGAKQQTLEVMFDPDFKFTIGFNETRTAADFQTHMMSLYYVYSKQAFPDVHPSMEGQNATAEVTGISVYRSAKDTSYKCDNQPTLNLSTSVVWSTTHVRSQAFMTGNKTDFSTQRECDADLKVNNIVPIAVGAALAGLVLIVLIAYLIGRKRSRRGYESV